MLDLAYAALLTLASLPVILLAVVVWSAIEVFGCDWRKAWKSLNRPI